MKRIGFALDKVTMAKGQDLETEVQPASPEFPSHLVFRSGPNLRLKRLCFITFNTKDDDMGERLKKMAAASPNLSHDNRQVEWANACHESKFEESTVAKVQHRSSDMIADVSGEKSSPDWILEHNRRCRRPDPQRLASTGEARVFLRGQDEA